uniref:Uncharacterized protein n=1 Tax=Rhizophora mucronata TaxID=61149 RepID=A0A2P2MVI7_RHIMU
MLAHAHFEPVLPVSKHVIEGSNIYTRWWHIPE